MKPEDIEKLCQDVAEQWIKNGAGPVLFKINIGAIAEFIQEKRTGTTVLSFMAETWWRGGGTKELFFENTGKISRIIKDLKIPK